MARLLASWFGSGFVPRLVGADGGGGTVAALLTLAPVWALGTWGWLPQAVLAVVVTIAGWWAARPFADGDPPWVVIDEAAGMCLAGIGLTGWPLVGAFIVFRIADITKALPGIRSAEKLPGVAGVMADDLVGALYGLAAGWLLVWGLG